MKHHDLALSRRNALGLIGATAGASILPGVVRAQTGAAQWHSTGADRAWQTMPVPSLTPAPASMFALDAIIRIDQPRQTMAGFGGAFTEKGWDALTLLSPADRVRALTLIFGEDGCGFNLCRTPIGANDISRKWYSYDEFASDFALSHFSVDNDRETLIPFIKSAQAIRPVLRVWASPWSPPTWMKQGGHYAQAPAWPGQPNNGIRPDQLGHEGYDSFILEDRYLDAYARYFRRYVEAYAREGIRIDTVMPQNEFNSAQPFPSCCWTPEGLARFMPHLGREMAAVGTRVFFGTLERGKAKLFEKVMADPAAAAVVRGIGVQWAGKDALPRLREHFPDIELWASEQECGVGTNDWHYARYSWGTIKRYFAASASAWTYWNMVMPTGGMSGWGWPQNSMIVVDPATRSFATTPDYWLMRHLAGSVRAGARALPVDSFFGFDDQLAFRNPDGSLVLVASNALSRPQTVRYAIAGKCLTVDLPPDSLNTLLIPGALLV